MNKYLILLILLTLSIHVEAQCPSGDLNFSSQSQVDQFILDYPNCTELEGITISGNVSNLSALENIVLLRGLNIHDTDSLVNLQGLNNLKFLWGSFEISENSALINFEGLDKLELIWKHVSIYNNDMLSSFQGFENLSRIASFITINDNDALINFTGLEKITELEDGAITITDNQSLTNLSGLNNLTSVFSSIHINGNPSLISLEGLNNLTTLPYGGLRIVDNDTLASITALENLTSINGVLSISNNNQLTSLFGIENIEPTGIQSLHISNNYELAICEVESICNYLKIDSIPETLIASNADGCRDQEEIEMACGIVPTEDINSQNNSISIFPNPTSDFVTIATEIGNSYTILDVHGRILQQGLIGAIQQVDLSALADGLYLIQVNNRNAQRIIKCE